MKKPSKSAAVALSSSVALGIAALAMVSAAAMPNAASAADQFKGKKITFYVGTRPGGGYDAYARLVGATFANQLPGTPTIIVKNMPGASGVKAANHVFNKSKKDGTELLFTSSAVAFAPLLDNKKALYKPSEWTWVGNVDQTTATCTVWHTSPVKKFQDLLTHSVNFGASGPAGAASQYARALSAMFGTRIRTIHGYIGTGTVVLAMERGELDGACSLTLSSLKSVFKGPYDAGKIRPILQFAQKSDDLKGVPHLNEFAKNAEDRNVIKLIFDRHRLGRPMIGPGGISQATTKVLRTAFSQTMKDPKFLDTAKRKSLTINPMTGNEVEDWAKDFLASATPKALVSVRKILAVGKIERVKLKSLDAAISGIQKNMVEFKDQNGKSHRVKVSNRQTRILIGGKKVKAKALKVGLSCSLRYFGEGDLAKAIACK
jgi:tripartite-type tricarboxylate transporter receptor subunit TctC